MPETYAHALPKGCRIEEYEIVRVLGAGGFGITYLAFDHKLDGPIALKEYFPAGFAVRRGEERVVAASPENRETYAWGLDRSSPPIPTPPRSCSASPRPAAASSCARTSTRRCP